jgi:hypothetical protein
LQPAQHGGRLLALCWQQGDEADEFVAVLTRSIKAAARYLGDRDSPTLAAARLLFTAFTEHLGPAIGVRMLGAFVDQLPLEDRFEARLVPFEVIRRSQRQLDA